jgi:uncharacterized protein YeeX (DUF496 family)
MRKKFWEELLECFPLIRGGLCIKRKIKDQTHKHRDNNPAYIFLNG